MSSSAPLKRPGENDIGNEQAPFKKARTTAPTPSASPPSTTNAQPLTPPQTLLPGLGMNGGGSVTFPTPPSTAGFQSHIHPGPGSVGSGGPESEQQTPAAEQEATAKNAHGGDTEMAEALLVEEAMETTGHRRTDHERKEGTGAAISSLPGASSLYLLPTNSIPPSAIPLSANLLELYDLTALQTSVARRDPVTGEKINVLRKHYANKVKALGLEGKDRPMKKPGELFGLVDPGWDTQVADGRTLWQAGREEALLDSTADEEVALGKLNSAFSGFKVGHFAKNEHDQWRNLLGLDEAPVATNGAAKQPPLPAIAGTKAPTGTSAFLAKTAPASAARNSAPASPSRFAGRPERAGKKRRYDESSYEGYDEDGYSTGGVDDTGGRRGSSGKRQKRKDFNSANTPPYANTNAAAAASSSASMVGVRSS